MQLLRALRPFNSVLFVLGVNPIIISETGHLVRLCHSRRLYTYVFMILVIPFLIANIRIELLDMWDSHRPLQTRNIVQLIQVTLLMTAYIVVLSFGLLSAPDKCAFFNSMNHFHIVNDAARINGIFQIVYAETIILNSLHLVLVLLLGFLIKDDFVSSLVLFSIVLTVNVQIFSMRAIIMVLERRIRSVRVRLSANLHSKGRRFHEVIGILDQFDRLWQLYGKFNQIFGGFLGLHFILDLIMITMLLFVIWYQLAYVGGPKVLMICTVAVFTRIIPVGVKMLLLIRPFERLAGEVSDRGYRFERIHCIE